jgi:hypothetical protein
MKRSLCREERIRVFVTYADTTGFTTWAKRGATSYEDISAYNRQMYDEFRRYEAESGFEVKYLCDGFVSFKEMARGHNCGFALSVLKNAWLIQRRMDAIIQSLRHPRPLGFRVRVACGMVSKIWVPPIRKADRRWRIEYIGFSPSLGDRLLEIEREISCICTETVRDLLRPNETSVTFQKVAPKGITPRGVDEEDMKELLAFKCPTEKGERNANSRK